MRGDDPRIAALPDIHGHAKGEHKPFAEERPIPYTARMLFLWFFHACRRASPRFLMVADHMNYLTFEDPAAVNLVRRALKLAQAGDLHGAAETAGVELAHAAAVSDGLRKGMRYSIGAEVDNDPRCRPDAQNIVEAMRPDGTIRSVHFVPITHPQHGENWMWAFDNPEFKELFEVVGVERTWELYMATLLEAIEKLPGNIVGHFYVPAKFGHWPDEATLETYEDQLLDACLARGLAVEVNSRYFYKFYAGDEFQLEKYRLAHLRLLRKAKAKGVMIAVGSDAHSPKDQGAAFDVVLALLDEAGINEIAFPINGRLARVALRATEEILRQHAAALAPVAAATSGAAASNGNVPPADSAADEDAEEPGPLPGALDVALPPAPEGEGDGVVAAPRKRRPKAAAAANGTGSVIMEAVTEATREPVAPLEHELAPAAQERSPEPGWDNDGAETSVAAAVSEEPQLHAGAEEAVPAAEEPAPAGALEEPPPALVAEESHPPAPDGASPSSDVENALPVGTEAVAPAEAQEVHPALSGAEPAVGSPAAAQSDSPKTSAPARPRVRAPKRVPAAVAEAESAAVPVAPEATDEATKVSQPPAAAPARKRRPPPAKVRTDSSAAEAPAVVSDAKPTLETSEAPAFVAVANVSKAAPEKRSRSVASAKAAPSAVSRSKKTPPKVAAPKRLKKADAKPASSKPASAKKATLKSVSAKKAGPKKAVAKKATAARSSAKRSHKAAAAKGGPARKSSARATKRVLTHKASGKKSLPKKPAAKKKTKSRR